MHVIKFLDPRPDYEMLTSRVQLSGMLLHGMEYSEEDLRTVGMRNFVYFVLDDEDEPQLIVAFAVN